MFTVRIDNQNAYIAIILSEKFVFQLKISFRLQVNDREMYIYGIVCDNVFCLIGNSISSQLKTITHLNIANYILHTAIV